jgi:hypothetical protein
MQSLLEVEERGWQALSTEGNAGEKYYRAILHDEAVMLLPGGMRLTNKEEILDALAGQPWQEFQIEDAQEISLDQGVGVLVYRVAAKRAAQERYSALISSTYVFRGGMWQLIVHQQTPVS